MNWEANAASNAACYNGRVHNTTVHRNRMDPALLRTQYTGTTQYSTQYYSRFFGRRLGPWARWELKWRQTQRGDKAPVEVTNSSFAVATAPAQTIPNPTPTPPPPPTTIDHHSLHTAANTLAIVTLCSRPPPRSHPLTQLHKAHPTCDDSPRSV